MVEGLGFGHFRRALDASGIGGASLEPKREIPRLIERTEISPELLDKVTAIAEKLANRGYAMPWLHITIEALQQKDGTTTPVSFIENIYENGFNIRTNGATFVRRDGDVNPRIAEPSFFVDHPEELIEDVFHIVKKYMHHGVRSNKKQLGYHYKQGYRSSTLSSQGIGIPRLMIADASGIRLERGIDGDEHYVTQNRILPEKIIGDLPLQDVRAEDKSTVLNMVDTMLDQIDSYLERSLH